MKKIILVVALIISCLSIPVYANPKSQPIDLEQYYYSMELSNIKYFCAVNVCTDGSAAQIGLNEKELTDFLRLKYKNNISLPILPNKILEKNNDGLSITEDKGEIWVTVWTIGDNYPVAYYIRMSAGNATNIHAWEQEYLGYDSKENIPNIVKTQLTNMMEKFAIDFYKARKEL